MATWPHKFSGDRMVVEVIPFAANDAASLPLDHLFDGVGQLLGAKSITVRTA